jgi:hypothetical protein
MNMSYLPPFMTEREAYERDKAQVTDLSTWREFQTKWFGSKKWPDKISEQLAEESKRKRGPLIVGGRRWGYTTFTKDITPEARYEYFSVIGNVGSPLIARKYGWQEWNPPKTPPEGWSQECPFDEIATSEIDEKNTKCPLCGRELIWVNTAD